MSNEKALVIRNKFDKSGMQAIIDLGYPENKDYILDLLKWTYDFHIPIFSDICCYLESLNEEQHRVLTFAVSVDYDWNLLGHLSDKYFDELENDLKPLGVELKQFNSMQEPCKEFFLQNRDRWLNMIVFPTYTKIKKSTYGEYAIQSNPRAEKDDVEFFALKCSYQDHRNNIFKYKLHDKISSCYQKLKIKQREIAAVVYTQDLINYISRLYLNHYQDHINESQEIAKELKKEVNELVIFIDKYYCRALEKRLLDGGNVELDEWPGLCRMRSNIEIFNQMFEHVLDRKLDTLDIDDYFKQSQHNYHISDIPPNIPPTHWWWFA